MFKPTQGSEAWLTPLEECLGYPAWQCTKLKVQPLVYEGQRRSRYRPHETEGGTEAEEEQEEAELFLLVLWWPRVDVPEFRGVCLTPSKGLFFLMSN